MGTSNQKIEYMTDKVVEIWEMNPLGFVRLESQRI